MANMFALILVIATLVTGFLWCLDKFIFAPKRRERQAAAQASEIVLRDARQHREHNRHNHKQRGEAGDHHLQPEQTPTLHTLSLRRAASPLPRIRAPPATPPPPVPREPGPEVTAVTTALNQLVSRLNLTLDRERLFTADVAHELRTPLAGLRLHLELLAKVHGMGVDPLIQRLDQMTTSISQLLQLARVGQSFSAGSYQQVLLLDDVVKPLQDELEAMLAQRQQRLLLTDIENEAVVSGDATLIRVILRNLVENAHRYSPEGSTIRVSVKAGLMPVMAVEDEGPGIDEAKSGELSKAFVRMDSRYGGIGLGLSIVTRIAQLHDAQFFLHNRQPGPGVRAWVLFPQRGGQNVSTH